jgi:1-acyl-sn-glycerol-3-phosphate acyltransferase
MIVLRFLATVWFWLALFGIALVLLPFSIAILLLTLEWDEGRRYIHAWCMLHPRILFALSPLWRIRFVGTPPHKGPWIVVANHESNLDPLLVATLPLKIVFISKMAILHVPIFGWQARWMGMIGVHRGNKESGKEALEKCEKALKKGFTVGIFAEGTRSQDGALGPFKDGAFKLALATGWSVLPVALHGTRDLLPKHSMLIAPGKITVRILEPVATDGETVESLKHKVREAILAGRAPGP